MNVTIRQDGKKVLVTAGYMGDSETFALYREACALGGAKYYKPSKETRVLPERVPQLTKALEAVGFVVTLEGDLGQVYAADDARAARIIEGAKRRIHDTNLTLAQRNQSLYAFQPDGIVWIAPRKRALLTDDMGLGKTLQLMLAADYAFRGVWVCPHSLKLNVKREAAMWRPDIKVTILDGRGSFRWPESNEIVVLNYDILPGEIEEVARGRAKVKQFVRGSIPPPPDGLPVYLIADECHALKNPKARRTMLFRGLSDVVMDAQGYTWGATGTEMPNRPPELWSVLQAFDLHNDAFGSWNRFADLFNAQGGDFGLAWGKPKPEVAARLRTVSLKRMKVDVLKDLPEKRYSEVLIEIDEDTKIMCDEVEALLKARGYVIAELEAAVISTKLVGPGFDMLAKAMMALSQAKVKPVLDLIEQYEEANEPIVVFCAHEAPVALLGARPGWGCITGKVSKDERDRLVQEFQAGRLKGIAGTAAMGEGLTLTRASNLLRISRFWTPAANRQAEDRINRIGQKRGVMIVDIIANHSLDKNLTAKLVVKAELNALSTEAAALKEGERPAEYAPLTDRPASSYQEAVRQIAAAAPLPVWRTTQTGAHIQVPGDAPVSRRTPGTDLELWAGRGIIILAENDPDRAAARNGAGFSKFDQDFGHKLANRLQVNGGLSDREWGAAVRLARKYRRQLSPEPVAA